MSKNITSKGVERFGRAFESMAQTAQKPCCEAGCERPAINRDNPFQPPRCEFHQQVWEIITQIAGDVCVYVIPKVTDPEVLRCVLSDGRLASQVTKTKACERRLRVLAHGHHADTKSNTKVTKVTKTPGEDTRPTVPAQCVQALDGLKAFQQAASKNGMLANYRPEAGQWKEKEVGV